MNAIILAGKDNHSKEELRKQERTLGVAYPGEHYLIGEEDYKPLIKINGKPIVQYVIDACKNSRDVDNVFVVGYKCRLEKELEGGSVIESCGSLIQNALKGYSESHSKGYALFLSCDIPLINGRHVDEFITDCLKYDNGLFVSVVEQEYLDGYEMNNRKCFSLKEGNYRWANMFFGNPEKLKLEKLNRVVDIVYRNRKLMSPAVQWNLVKGLKKELPLGEIFSKAMRYFVTSRLFKSQKLGVCELEKMARDCLNIDLKMVEIRHHEPSLDIDSMEDLEYVKKLISYV